MKNKTKKILAGACLGLVGMGCLTGCSMNDEQKAALDLITEKSDEIVTLLEENMEYNNKKLSKDDAAEKILLARSRWKMQSFNELEYSLIQNSYNGVFDSLKSTYTSDESTPWRWLYRNDNGIKVFATAEGNVFDSIRFSDFDQDKHLDWRKGDDSFEARDYQTSDFLFNVDVLYQIGISTITPEQIKDIEIVDNGYVFKVLVEEGDSYSEVTFNVSFDNYIISFVANRIDAQGSEYESWHVECKYQYNNVNFESLDQKIKELES